MSEFNINPEILKTPVQDNKILLLEPSRGHYFELNETSVLIYQALEAGEQKQRIIERLISEFDCDKKQASQDFEELITQFKQNKILL